MDVHAVPLWIWYQGNRICIHQKPLRAPPGDSECHQPGSHWEHVLCIKEFVVTESELELLSTVWGVFLSIWFYFYSYLNVYKHSLSVMGVRLSSRHKEKEVTGSPAKECCGGLRKHNLSASPWLLNYCPNQNSSTPMEYGLIWGSLFKFLK